MDSHRRAPSKCTTASRSRAASTTSVSSSQEGSTKPASLRGSSSISAPKGSVEVAYLVGGRQPRLARHPDRAQAADLAERVPLVHLGVGQRVQGDGRVAGAARPAAQGDLLGHRARREERGGLLAEQSRDLLLQGLDDPVAVDVGRLVQVVQVLRASSSSASRSRSVPQEAGAREHPLGAPERGAAPQPPFAAPCRAARPRPASVRSPARLLRRIAHARIMPARVRAGTRISTHRWRRVHRARVRDDPQPVDNRTPLEPIALT